MTEFCSDAGQTAGISAKSELAFLRGSGLGDVAAYRKHGETGEIVLKVSDDASYRAKQSARIVCLWLSRRFRKHN